MYFNLLSKSYIVVYFPINLNLLKLIFKILTFHKFQNIIRKLQSKISFRDKHLIFYLIYNIENRDIIGNFCYEPRNIIYETKEDYLNY